MQTENVVEVWLAVQRQRQCQCGNIISHCNEISTGSEKEV